MLQVWTSLIKFAFQKLCQLCSVPNFKNLLHYYFNNVYPKPIERMLQIESADNYWELVPPEILISKYVTAFLSLWYFTLISCFLKLFDFTTTTTNILCPTYSFIFRCYEFVKRSGTSNHPANITCQKKVEMSERQTKVL